MNDIDVLLQENRRFPPPPHFQRDAQVGEEQLRAFGRMGAEDYWAQEAGRLQWSRPWRTVMQWEPPHVGHVWRACRGSSNGARLPSLAKHKAERCCQE